MSTKHQRDETIVILKLEGEDKRRFEEYMEREHIEKKAPAAKKLMLDRLDDLARGPLDSSPRV